MNKKRIINNIINGMHVEMHKYLMTEDRPIPLSKREANMIIENLELYIEERVENMYSTYKKIMY